MEDIVDLQSLIQFPVNSGTALLDTFPVAEPSHLDNLEISFLDEFCALESKEHPGTAPMALSNSMEGISLAGTLPLSTDWLTENININFGFSGGENLQESEVLNKVLYNINSVDESCDIFSGSDFSAIKLGFQLPIHDSLTKLPDSVKKLHSSCNELAEIKVSCDKSPLPSANEVTIEHNDEEMEPCVAGRKYLQMRKKNNIASQRSRKLRKQKNQEMWKKLTQLETENRELQTKVIELEKQRDSLQKQLLQIISKK